MTHTGPGDGTDTAAAPTDVLGTLAWAPATEHPELLADATAQALARWALDVPEVAHQILVAEIDPDLSDTAAMSDAYAIPLEASVNCVLVGGRREGTERVAALAVRASTRADVNGTVKKLLDVRKASFAPMDRAVTDSGMEHGGITPVGLDASWPLLVDAAALTGTVIIGSGVRRSKLALPGALLATLPGARVVEGLAR